MKKEVEMKNDGKDLQRFQAMLKTVVSVPKNELKKAEEKQKKEGKVKS